MSTEEDPNRLLRTYIGASFAVFLGFLPPRATSLIPALRSRNEALRLNLLEADEDLAELRYRRKEDSKANARVVEIFAGHRHAWQQEEKRLLLQIEGLRARVEELEATEAELRRGIEERDEMLGFMARREEEEDSGGCGGHKRFGDLSREIGERDEMLRFIDSGDGGAEGRFGDFRVPAATEEYFSGREGLEILNSGSKFWAEKASLWQDIQYESDEPLYHSKQFVPRREYPWKIDGETAGVSSKLKLLEQELLNLERMDKSDFSKIPSQMRKQAKRYQALAGKIDELCKRMQASDPSEATLSSEFRTQRQTEFLLEAFRLQHRATETAQKLIALQTETGKSYFGNEAEGQAKLTTRRCLDSVKNNLREIQRNLEIWLARIIGDLEGILARDGVSRVRDCYMSRYPFVQ